MSAGLYANLAWLPRPPADFRRRCRELTPSSGGWKDARRLAGCALDENQLRVLAAAIERLRASGDAPAGLVPFALGIAGDVTLEPLVPALTASALRHGILLRCTGAAFAQTMQSALDPQSEINRAGVDAVLLALDHRALAQRAALGNPAAAEGIVEDALAHVARLRRGFRDNGVAPCILQTLPPPPETLFGSADRAIAGTPRALVAAFNDGLTAAARAGGDAVLDVAALAETVGLVNWHSPAQWNLAKLPFASAYLPLYAEHVARLIGALRGRSRRCLILDLDDTLWGGVIGDDGVEGIAIGPGDATGEAFLELHRAALALRERGVVLAVCSKNDERIAHGAFAHPDMLLRTEHFAAFRANWDDKATNVAAIGAELGLGLDALVLVDDNPAERGLVRELLPDVAVPELPDDPALYARTLAAAGYFEAVAFSDEDRNRAGFYAGNARRSAARTSAGDLDAYLASLAMEIAFAPFDAIGRPRITQLVNKSNQFNLTTRRYPEHEIAALERDPDVFTLQVRLADSFGDNGMIGVVICRPLDPVRWEIDTWLMSCRVLGRGVERMVLREILEHARARGVRELVGTFVPSGRNAMVEGHYERLGFRLLERAPSGATSWSLGTEVHVDPAPMTVVRAGFVLSAV